MEETLSQWSYGLLKNGACIAPDTVRSSLIVGNKDLFIRVQGLNVGLFVRGQPVNLAPYLVYASPNIAGTIPVREYEGGISGYRFGIYCVDVDIDIDLIQPDGTVWRGMCSYQEE